MNKYDARGYKKLRYRYIIGYMFVVWIVITVAVIMAPVTAIFFVLVAVGSGWQRGNTVSKGDGTNDCADNEHDFGDSQAGDEPTLDELLDLLQNGKSPLLDFNKQRIRDYAERLAAEARIDELRKFNSDVLEVEKVGGGWLSDEIAEFAKQILEFNDARIATLTKEKQ